MGLWFLWVREIFDRMKNRKRFATAIGMVIGLVAVAFVIRALFSEWDATKDALVGVSWGWLALGVFTATAAMVVIAWVWTDVIEALTQSTDTPERLPALSRVNLSARYFVGELGKYLPGGIWTVVGRSELARRGGINRAIAYSSVALSLIALYLAGAGVAAALIPFDLAQQNHGMRTMVGLGVVILGGVVILHPKTLNLLLQNAERITKRGLNLTIPPGRATGALVLRYVPAWIAIAASSYAVARAITPEASLPKVALATIASWIAGFVAVPVPAGGGVREAVFLALCGLPAGIGAAVALISRLLFVLIDAIGAAAGSFILRRSVATSPLPTEKF